ncbi:MBL fold metallo-hydrolase [Pontibacter silvestris]|uniref:MBL fold metallo-hydrolase n=1 Tax=Pontibacter silvestris TaxID=2305183 RepID=A0ABW4X2V4_9BACT|nr:MBL fold metallo-hydrolase [Pontibacter silvestris]MCC9137546.1 MBL fold metallo-hydrolase [Pontibacter silvestris]
MKSNIVILFMLLFSHMVAAQTQPKNEKIEAKKLSEHIYVLTGEGGNVGVAVTRHGVYMIDDKFAYLSDEILAAVKRITDQPVRYLVNTHWHGDHTGGNENIAREGAVIIAHNNVYERMSTKQFRSGGIIQEPSPNGALP